MRRSLAKFSESEASNHTPSLADFTTSTPELKFSVHTRVSSCGAASLQVGIDACGTRGDFQRRYGTSIGPVYCQTAWPLALDMAFELLKGSYGAIVLLRRFP